jgi:hypothetical protein
MTLTGIPAGLVPGHEVLAAVRAADNNVFLVGAAFLQWAAASTTITLYQNWQGSGWTASGVKGFGTITLMYLLA